MKSRSYDSFFANFSNGTRLAIILCLKEKALSVGEIVEKVGGEQSNVSHHLEHLRRCKILNVEKKGKKRIYSLNKKTVMPMLRLVEKHVCNNCESCPMGCGSYAGG
ncbi:MAG: metalloregulator ArsR/SmtB family transcription factor [Nanoarchaeota archaeon]|nr:metalloregulator ArsR/SmtB family transcription factor [Nanoarchaeota archaeon]MBU1052146.1 metalloregulator ArsR/SmtB family transcription factor [Nanoarchaeota archaeon]MBU1988581.1 metalloregulator ArsR/SmtB family transcription factor [Nanoarchaeota archaeon]